jgi:hypothetical protein
MSVGRRLLFSLITLLVVLSVMEGAARVLWWSMEQRAFHNRKASGEVLLRNDAINFMKQADGTFGYVLIPGFSRGGVVINADGFAQRETVPLAKRAGVLRLAAMGESTTQGVDVDTENYPVHLRRRIERQQGGYAGVEMVNGGVAGWISDQVALWAQKKGRCVPSRRRRSVRGLERLPVVRSVPASAYRALLRAGLRGCKTGGRVLPAEAGFVRLCGLRLSRAQGARQVGA